MREPAPPRPLCGETSEPHEKTIDFDVKLSNRAGCGGAIGRAREIGRLAEIFQLSSSGDNGGGIEIRGRPFQSMRRSSKRFSIQRTDGAIDSVEMPRRVLEKQAADFDQQVPIAADPREQRVEGIVDRTGGVRLRLAIVREIFDDLA